MYVCGITPYDYAHVGHGRCYVTFDMLYRLLTFMGYDVVYCRNFTDVDDKILTRAQKEFGDQHAYGQVTEKYIKAYTHDMNDLNCITPQHQPYVTRTMPEIIDFIAGLIEKGHAYVVDGDVYFSIKTFNHYGQLSKRDAHALEPGARVDVNDKKRDPRDFALWKSEPEGEFFKSPWGYGRPGWHIECSAMAKKYLGITIDIHAGGLDLLFPHHENEIAQSQALHGQTFARYWIHNGFVCINQEKMSKSLGNFFTLRQVFERFSPMLVRFYLISQHYRNPLNFAFDDIAAMHKTYQRLTRLFQDVPTVTPQMARQSPIAQKMLACLSDDLNTSAMLAVLFENITTLTTNRDDCAAVKTVLQQIVGLSLEPLPEASVDITPEIQTLIDARIRARAERNFKRADEIRDQLIALGYDVQDKKL